MMNAELFKSKLDNNTIKHYGGNVTDNASDAKKESQNTFNDILPNDRLEHGVVPKPILLCDPFHIDNLAVTHASLAAFGVTERGNHRQ